MYAKDVGIFGRVGLKHSLSSVLSVRATTGTHLKKKRGVDV